MTERPILFTAETVRAILDGRKTQTRRLVKPQPVPIARFGQTLWALESGSMSGEFSTDVFGACAAKLGRCPFGAPGDRLWVRETWCLDGDRKEYRAGSWGYPKYPRWRPSIHMPRWASRLTLEVTGVRVERLQEISAADALAEGVEVPPEHALDSAAHVAAYRALWESMHPGGWEANPWVWVIQFRRLA